MKSKVICLIMGGGRGTRLFPLTNERCKPAVPLAGKYRLVDIPISNCVNSGLNQIFVLTQFNTASLHRHIQEAYKFDPFGGGFVDILSAEQTAAGDTWYQGTADAVRQNLHHIDCEDQDLVLILSGDQLYQMDFRRLVAQHFQSKADVTIAAKAMRTADVSGLGLMQVNDDLSIAKFVEKPTDPKVIEGLAVSDRIRSGMKDAEEGSEYVLANMGIYLFNAGKLRECLNNQYTDFGKEIIPDLLDKMSLKSFIFEGYWEDIGTVRAFFDANLQLTDAVPPFNFFDEENRVYTRARFLPAAKINSARLDQVIMAGGAILTDCHIHRSVIGVRSIVRSGTRLDNVVMMGADWFETAEEKTKNHVHNRPKLGVGKDCHIRETIIDKNARIGDNVRLDPAGKPDGFEYGDILVRDGVLVVGKGGVVPAGTIVAPDQ